MSDNMMRIAGRDPEDGVAKALSVTVDPDGNGVLRTHEAAPWFVPRDMYGNILDIKVDVDGTLRVNDSRPQNVALINATLTSADTEYQIMLPSGTKRFKLTVRDGVAANKYRIAYESGKVAASTAPFLSFTQDKEYTVEKLDLYSANIYIASSLAAAVAQVEAWY